MLCFLNSHEKNKLKHKKVKQDIKTSFSYTAGNIVNEYGLAAVYIGKSGHCFSSHVVSFYIHNSSIIHGIVIRRETQDSF